MRRVVVLLPLVLAMPASAQVGAITGEKRLSTAVEDAAADCKAGAPVTGTAIGSRVPVVVDVPGLESLACLVARIGQDPTRAQTRVERVACAAPDRASDLRCELGVAAFDVRRGTFEGDAASWVTAVLAGAKQSELDAERLVILPDRIELAGDVPSEDARAHLEAVAAKRGVPVRSFGLTVREPLDPAEMPALAKGAGAAQLHLAGVPAAAALVLLDDRTKPFVARAGGAPLTGRIAGANRAALAKALAAAHPIGSISVPSGGSSRKVTISFQQVEAFRLSDILEDVQKLSAVLPPGLPAVTVNVRNVPADSVSRSLAKLFGLTRQKSGSLAFYVPAGTKLRAAAAKEPDFTLTLSGATAPEALSLLATVGPPAFCLPAGEPLHATLTDAPPTMLAEAVRVIDGGTPADAAGCAAPSPATVDKPADLSKTKVIATLTGAVPARALVRREDGSAALLELEGERAVLTADAPAGYAPEAPLADHRLIATLVSAQGSAAVLEGRRGRIRVVRPASTLEGRIEVFPGRVRITEEGYDVFGFRSSVQVREMRMRPVVR